MEPKKQLPGPRVSRATSMRLERQKLGSQSGTSLSRSGPSVESSGGGAHARDPSPTKLPVGTFQRSNAGRQPQHKDHHAMTSGHKRKTSAVAPKQPLKDPVSSQPNLPPGPKLAEELPSTNRADSKTLGLATRRFQPRNREGGHNRTISENQVIGAARIDETSNALATAKKVPNVEASTHLQKPSFEASSQSRLGAPRKQPTPTRISSSNESTARQRSFVESSLELLQLHAIHSKSARAQKEWTESARAFYEARFKNVVSLKKALDARQKDLLTQRNATAIIDWGSRAGGDTLERRVQVFSSILDEIWQLTSPVGRYTSIVQAFEHWYEQAEGLDRREEATGKPVASSRRGLESLGDGWKSEVSTLQEALLTSANLLLSLGDIEGDSDIARSITLLLEMTKNMLEELELMESVEESLVLQNQFWVQSSINELSKGIPRH